MELPHHIRTSECQKARYSKSAMIGATLGFLVPVLLPFVHLGVISHLWDEFNYKVDRRGCSCSCWDTIFKGIYERGPSGYKHVYFNITSNSFKIWSVTVLAILLVYEAVKKVIRLYLSGQIRTSMFVLLLASVYPHYYSWWSYFNYWNDDFYTQWSHQLFFSFTELASTLAVVYLLDKYNKILFFLEYAMLKCGRRYVCVLYAIKCSTIVGQVNITARRVLIIIDIAVLHIFSSSFDQFVDNVVNGNGMLHQVLRDIFFMIPDLLHVVLPFMELREVARSHDVPTVYMISNKEFFFSVTFVISGWFVCLIL